MFQVHCFWNHIYQSKGWHLSRSQPEVTSQQCISRPFKGQTKIMCGKKFSDGPNSITNSIQFNAKKFHLKGINYFTVGNEIIPDDLYKPVACEGPNTATSGLEGSL